MVPHGNMCKDRGRKQSTSAGPRVFYRIEDMCLNTIGGNLTSASRLVLYGLHRKNVVRWKYNESPLTIVIHWLAELSTAKPQFIGLPALSQRTRTMQAAIAILISPSSLARSDFMIQARYLKLEVETKNATLPAVIERQRSCNSQLTFCSLPYPSLGASIGGSQSMLAPFRQVFGCMLTFHLANASQRYMHFHSQNEPYRSGSMV